MRIILIVSFMILLATAQSLFCKLFTDRYAGDPSTITPVLSITVGVMMTVVAFIFSGFRFEACRQTVLLGIVNSVALYGYNFLMVKAALMGEYSILMACNLAGGIVVPSVIEAVVFSQPLGIVRLFAMALVVVAGYLINCKNPAIGAARKTNRWFLPVCIALGVTNGIYGELLNVQQRLCSPDEREEMIAITYLGTVVFSVVYLLISRRGRLRGAVKFNRSSLIFLLICSTSTALAVNILVLVIALLDNHITVLYTFDNAGVLLLSVIASCVLFKEKLNTRNMIGCGLMCAALTVMSVSDEISTCLPIG